MKHNRFVHHLRRAVLALAVLGVAEWSSVRAETMAEVLAAAPVIEPQPDGVVCLGVDAAAIVKRVERQEFLVNGGGGSLRIDNGRIVRWAGDNERPVWRIRLPTNGLYRVVINHVTLPGRGGLASVNFTGTRRGAVSRRIESTGTTDALAPFPMGEINLDAGEYLVEFRPVSWTSLTEFSRLADVRLIPLEPLRKLRRPADDILRKLGVDARPAVAELAAKVKALQQESDALNREVRRRDFSVFTIYEQFFAFDRSPARLAEVERQLRDAAGALDDLRLREGRDAVLDASALPPAERGAFESYAAAIASAAAAETRAYPISRFPAVPPRMWGQHGDRGTLFPTGRVEDLPPQTIDEHLPRATLAVAAPPDAAARSARFASRNDKAGLAALCGELQRALRPGAPGLADFERLCREGRPGEALEAYRAYFFDKLAHPDRHGAAQENILFELTRDRGRGHLLYRPSPLALTANLDGSAVIQVRSELVTGAVGKPGAVSWVPHGLTLPGDVVVTRSLGSEPFWRTDAGRAASRAIEFFRCLTVLPSDRAEYQSGGFFPALFFSYAVTGDRSHLARWCEYADDWCLNAKRDQENSPYPVRAATELEPQQVRCMLTFLRIVLDERPALAADFDAATLARLMLKLTTDYAPYTIRARRAEMANWGIMGLAHQLHLGRFLSEFKAMEYVNRETWRLWNANMIQHRTLDGENFEAWDDGHNFIDIGFAYDSVPFARLPAGADELDLAAFWDHIRVDQRSKLTHVTPGGEYWPFWEVEQGISRNTIRGRVRPDAVNRHPLDLILDEPGARDRYETIMGVGEPTGGRRPDRCSDASPYAAMYYLRESWRPEADHFILQNFRERSQGQEDCSRTMYSLSKSDRILVEAHGLVVDRKADNRYQGKVATGGKTDFCGQAGRQVSANRFHASARFDFAEATQDAPYARHRKSHGDVYGLYRQAMPDGDPDPITDVTVLRQVFGVRGEGLWLVCDRIENRGAREREYTQFFTLPVRLAENGFADRVRLLEAAGTVPVGEDAAAHRIRTTNPGFDNVSIHCFAPMPLTFANVLNARGEHEAVAKPPLQALAAALKAGRTPAQILKNPPRRPVSVRWSGAGNQVFVAALCSRPAVFDLARPFEGEFRVVEELKGAGGALGCRIVTRSGAEAWFQSGPQPRNRLACGPVSADAESLLVVRGTNGTVSGVVLDCGVLTVSGRSTKPPWADVEFELDPAGGLAGVQPIHRPIDTVRILPEQNVFTDRIDVSFDIPTQKTGDIDFRYTLDGTDPTLAALLFTKPMPIDRTTVVKVRAFRKGLRATPWHLTGTEAGRTFSAIFRKRDLLPAQTATAGQVGLGYAYFEGDWPTLFSYAGFPGVLTPKREGVAAALLDSNELSRVCTTERAFAIRYEGAMMVPTSGVYTLFAPEHLLTPTMDAGYDLRVFIDDEEWFPSPTLHAENAWCVPLAAGAHRLRVDYVDYRWKTFRNEYWMAWQPEEMWSGVPVLEIAGPGLPRQPLPASWLRH